MVSMFWMRARIEARAHQVKRGAIPATSRAGFATRADVPDFAFDLNHIKDAFGSDMVKKRFSAKPAEMRARDGAAGSRVPIGEQVG